MQILKYHDNKYIIDITVSCTRFCICQDMLNFTRVPDLRWFWFQAQNSTSGAAKLSIGKSPAPPSSFLVNFVVVIWAHARFPLNVCVCSKGQKKRAAIKGTIHHQSVLDTSTLVEKGKKTIKSHSKPALFHSLLVVSQTLSIESWDWKLRNQHNQCAHCKIKGS